MPPMCQGAKGTFDATVSSAPDGTLMLVEPAASDRVEENLNPIGRIYYTGSTWLCCAHAISEEGTHVLGAQAGTARLALLQDGHGGSRKTLQGLLLSTGPAAVMASLMIGRSGLGDHDLRIVRRQAQGPVSGLVEAGHHGKKTLLESLLPLRVKR
jgi:hypothetical protein